MHEARNHSVRSTARGVRTVVGVGLAAAVVLAGLAGCGRLRDQPGQDGQTSELSWDAQALQTLGYAPAELVPAQDDSAGRDNGSVAPRARHPRLRFAFRHALHGEATVQTPDGLKTVVAQRGTVTEKTATAVTVTSSDGYTLTWTLDSRSVVVVKRARSTIDAVPVGTEVGVAGSRDGDTLTLRLLVLPRD